MEQTTVRRVPFPSVFESCMVAAMERVRGRTKATPGSCRNEVKKSWVKWPLETGESSSVSGSERMRETMVVTTPNLTP